jgi:hypothetical protein
MIHQSSNSSADEMMKVLEPVRGPLIVSEYMRKIGLENTFMAGYFCDPLNPCPLLQRFDTPASRRPDAGISNPDAYDQTTASDMGTLLEDIYQCAQAGGGALVAAFPDKINADVCKKIVDYLEQDKIANLIEAGVPEGTQVAMKHGWDDANCAGCVQHEIHAAAIVYTPGGNFVLSIYSYHPIQNLFNVTNLLMANLTRATYNYFNSLAP